MCCIVVSSQCLFRVKLFKVNCMAKKCLSYAVAHPIAVSHVSYSTTQTSGANTQNKFGYKFILVLLSSFVYIISTIFFVHSVIN